MIRPVFLYSGMTRQAAPASDESLGLVFAEEGWAQDDAYSELGVEAVIVEEGLAVAVVVLQEEVLVILWEDSEFEFELSVEIQRVPVTSLGEDH